MKRGKERFAIFLLAVLCIFFFFSLGLAKSQTFNLKGDINQDGSIDLTDLIIALQCQAGVPTAQTVHLSADSNGDGMIGAADALYIINNIGSGAGGTSSTDSGPGPMQGQMLSSDVKYAAEDKVTAEYNDLQQQGLTELDREQQLLAFMQADTDFAQVGQSDDGTIWARFSDNSYYLFNDRDVPDSGIASTASVQETGSPYQPSASAVQQAASSPGVPLADGKTAILFQPSATAVQRTALSSGVPLADGKTAILFDAFNGYLSEPNDKIATILGKRGYAVQNLDATLDNLKHVSNATVLYVSSHGGTGETYLHPGKFWSMWTDTEATAANDATYIDDLQAGRLVVFEAATGFGLLGYKQMERHYAITAAWVKYYNWSFTKHSVAFLNFCWSYKGGMTNSLRNIASPVGLALGWTNAAQPDKAWKSGLYFFDRCLGTAYKDPSIPQLPGKARPFPAQQVYAKMNSNGYRFADTKEFGASELMGLGSDVLLAPSVANMDTYDPGMWGSSTDKTKLIVHGFFGTSAPAKVTVGGTSVPFTYVSDQELDCDIPDTPGNGYAGPVEVSTDHDITSNTPSLTWWFGPFEYTGDPLPTQTTGKIDVDDANFRCDVHKYRTEVDGNLQDPAAVVARVNVDATAQWSQSGIPPGYKLGSPLSGTYTLGLVGSGSAGGGTYGYGFDLEAKVDRKAGSFGIVFNYLGTDVEGIVPLVPPTYFLIPHDNGLIASYLGRDKYGWALYAPKVLATLSASDLSVAANIYPGAESILGTTLSVPSMVPKYAPTADAEEDAP